MNILVAYATRAGSTAEVAAEVGRTIASKNGCQVDVCPAEGVADLSSSGAAIVGSGIRGGSWLPEAVQFVEQHREELARMPLDVGFFAGVMDYSKLPVVLRLMMKVMKAPQGDFRDWEAIRAWAAQVHARMAGSG